jgi:hypothetical protein
MQQNKVHHVIQSPQGHRRDERGAYIPICAYGQHPGLSLQADLCISYRCRHFRKVYMKDGVAEERFRNTDDEFPKCVGLDYQI